MPNIWPALVFTHCSQYKKNIFCMHMIFPTIFWRRLLLERTNTRPFYKEKVLESCGWMSIALRKTRLWMCYIKLHLIVKLQFWSLGYMEYPLITITLRSTQTRSQGFIFGSNRTNQLQRVIIICYLKPYSCVLIVCIKYLINGNTNVILKTV